MTLVNTCRPSGQVAGIWGFRAWGIRAFRVQGIRVYTASASFPVHPDPVGLQVRSLGVCEGACVRACGRAGGWVCLFQRVVSS